MITEYRKQYIKDWKEKNREHILAYHRKYNKKLNKLYGKEIYQKRKEYFKARNKNYIMSDKEKIRRKIYRKNYNKNPTNRIKTNARANVAVALKLNKLKKPLNCENCSLVKPLQGHHKDYSKPLEVTWLCRACHALEHCK